MRRPSLPAAFNIGLLYECAGAVGFFLFAYILAAPGTFLTLQYPEPAYILWLYTLIAGFLLLMIKQGGGKSKSEGASSSKKSKSVAESSSKKTGKQEQLVPSASRQSRDKRGIYQNYPLMLFTLDANGVILEANDTAQELLDCSPHELIGMPVLDLVYPGDREAVAWKISDAVNNLEQTIRSEFRVIDHTGNLLWVRESARARKNSHGDRRIFLIWDDITEKKIAEVNLQIAEARYRALVEQMPAAVYTELLNKKGAQVYINPQIEQMTGYKPEEWLADPELWANALYPEDRDAVVAEDRRTNASLEPYHMEYRLVAKDGRIVWLRDQAVIVRDEEGRPLYWQGVLIDISTQKQINEMVKQGEERFSQIFRASPIPTCITAKEDGRYIEANPAFLNLFGYSLEELIGHTVFEIDQRDPQSRQGFLERLSEEFSIRGTEERFTTKAGDILDVVSFYEFIDLNGQQCVLSMLYDITEQKKNRESLRQSERSYRGLFDTVEDAIYIQDEAGVFMDVNAGAARMYGFTREELIGKTPEDLAAPGKNNLEELADKIKLALGGQPQQFEFWGRRKNGEVFPKHVRLSKGSYFGLDGIIAFAEDITERKKAEEAVRAAEARYRALVENVPAVVYIQSIDNSETLYVNPQIEELTGYSSQEWSADPRIWAKCLHPEDRAQVLEREAEALKNRLPFNMEYRMITRDGRVIWVYDHATPIQGLDNEALYYQGVMIQTTKQRLAEIAVRQSEERFSRIFQSSPIAQCITSWEDARLIEANPAFWTLSGYSPGELNGRSVKETRANGVQRHQEILEELSRKKSLRDIDDIFIKKSGEILQVSIFHEIIQLNDQQCILSMFHDITEQKKAQEDLKRKEAILDSIAFAADEFLKAPKWSTRIDAILERLGQAAQASRVYIFKLLSNQGPGTVASQLYEWCAPDIVPMIGDPSLQLIDMTEAGLDRWTQVLKNGEPVYGSISELPEEEQGEFSRQHILSIICVPIMIAGKWWGFMGIDDCVRERQWSDNEIETLETAANILSAAIQRELVGEAAEKQLRELTMLHSVAQESSSATDIDSLINGITEIISEALQPANCGILLVDGSGAFLLPHQSYKGNVIAELEKQPSIKVGVAGMVVASGKPMRIPDVRRVPEFVEIHPGVLSELCVPIISKEKVIGVINLESMQLDAYDEADERLINTIAGSLSTAIGKLQLFEAERRRAREAESLREATTALTSSLDLATLLNTTLDLLMGFAPFDSASIELINNDNIKIVAGRNIPASLVGRSYTIDREKWGLNDLREPIIIPDVRLDDRFEKFEESNYIRSWMGIPLFARDRLIGFINLDNKLEDFYSQEHASLVQTFANQAAVAIQNAQLFDVEQQRRREAETLREAVAAVTADLDPEQAIQRILEELAKVVPYRTASVQTLSQGYLEIVGGAGWKRPSQVLGMHFPVPGNNPNTEVIRQRRSIVLGNAPEAYPPFRRSPHSHIHSWLGVPLIVRDNLIGMLAIDHAEPNFYTADHIRLAEIFANQAAIAMANVKSFQEEKKRTQIIEALADIANEFASTQETKHLLDKVAQRALELLRASHVAVYLVQNDNKTIKVVAAKGRYSQELFIHTLQVGEGITGDIIKGGKSEIISNIRADSRAVLVPGTPLTPEEGDIEMMMSSALIVRGKAIGAINAWRLQADGVFDESELNFLISIAHQTSISMEMSRLFEETAKHAQEAAAIAQVGQAISSTLQLDLVLERIAQYAKDLLMAETSAVYLVSDRDSKLHGVAVLGLDAKEIKADPLIIGQGITGQIAMSKVGEIVNYAGSDPRAVTIKGTQNIPIEHIMGVPVLNKDELTGLVVVWRTGTDQEFLPSELDFLSSLAQQAAIAIQNARSFEAEQKQRLREASMLELMRLAASSLDLDEVNLTILGHLVRLIPSDAGTIQLLKGERLQVSAATGFPPDTIDRGTMFLMDDFPINHEVMQQKKIVRISDTSQDSRYRRIPGLPSYRSMMAIPIIFRENLIGMATLDSFTPERFTQEDEELALAVANNLANAIGNARLFELEQEGRQQAENLRLAASAVTSSLDLQQVLETILTALKQVLHYDSASILLLEDDQVRITAAEGLPNLAEALNKTFPANNRLLTAIAENGNQSMILYDAQVDSRFEHWAASENVRGWMGVSLATRGEIVGYITLDSYNVGSFDENSASLAKTFAYQAAAAIDNARLYQETRRRLEELEVVSRVMAAVRATQDPQEMLPALLAEVLKVMNSDAASIWLNDPARNHLDQKVAQGWQEQVGIDQNPYNETFAGRVFRSGEIQIIDEFPSDIGITSRLRNETSRGWAGVGVPIRTSTQTIGAMIVAIPLSRKIEPSQIQLLATLAEIAGNAIHRAQLYAQSEEQVRRLTALRDVDTAIASSFDLRVTLNILLDHTISQLRADAAAIFSYNPDMRTLGYIASLGFRESGGIQGGLRITGRMLNEALLDRKNIHIENIAEEPLFYRKEIASREKFVSYYATPLISKGQVKGILEVYYRKPHPPEIDWLDFFQTMAGQAAIAIDNSQLFDNLQRSNQELSLAYDTTLEGWGKALELRDRETQGHTVRVADLTLRLARRMNIPEADLIHIRRGVLLHDIGKMAVPDHILKKPGPLDEQEWAEMRLHPQYAYDLLYPITYLRPAVDIPYSHHERWDGDGYPNHLKGEEIALSARIFSIVDVWDALLYDRPYRKAWSRQQVIEYIQGEIGTRFDPRVASEFLRMVEEDDLKAE